MNYMDSYNFWKTDKFFDIAIRNELLQLTDEKEIEDRFYKDLEFGTGGMRGLMGAGTNYINNSTFPADISKQLLYKCGLRVHPIGHFTFYAGCDIC